MMIMTAKVSGRATSRAACCTSRTTRGPVTLRSLRWRRMFSVMMTAPSTMIPKSMAPSESRLAGMPRRSMNTKAKSSESGIVSATMSADRRALQGGDHDVVEVVRRLHEADSAHHERVLALADVGAAGVGVVGGDGLEHLLEGHVVGAQALGIHDDLVLLDAAAPGDDVGHTGHLAELALQDPVLVGLEIDERHRLRLERVAVDLADRRGERAELRLGVGGAVGLGGAPAHLPPRPATVGDV